MSDVIELIECREDEYAEVLKGNMEYPCVVVEGITSNDEVEFFRRRQGSDEYGVMAYMMAGDEPISLGRFDLVLDNLLTVKSLFDYQITLYRQKGDAVKIDLNDAETLIKFIKL